jgi:hypothetical protein
VTKVGIGYNAFLVDTTLGFSADIINLWATTSVQFLIKWIQGRSAWVGPALPGHNLFPTMTGLFGVVSDSFSRRARNLL